MKVLWSWISELFKSGISPHEAAERLTMSGTEVEELYLPCGKAKGFLIVKILKITPNIDEKGNSLVEIDVGNGEVKRVVCGAKNIKEGMLVPYAPPGSILADGTLIKEVWFGDIKSEGMLLSADEIGLPDLSTEEGILIINQQAPLGKDFLSYFGLDTPVLDISITPNRGDCLSVIGIARELYGLVEDSELVLPDSYIPAITDNGWNGFFKGVFIKDKGCFSYALGLIEDVKIADSPMWLRTKVVTAGMRSISNAVDITNYILLLWGQPLHAFDLDLLPDREITVRGGYKDEKIVAIDGKEYILNENDLVISSGDKAVAMAGVMGGKDTEINENTKNIALECAIFSPKRVSVTSRRLGINSEASYRFARGVDLKSLMPSLGFALKLFAELGVGNPKQDVIFTEAVPYKSKVVELTKSSLKQVLCFDDLKAAKQILVRLGFSVKDEKEDKITFIVPSYRQDISIEEDLIEEVARVRGYDKIPIRLPVNMRKSGELPKSYKLKRLINNLFTSRGYIEAVTYSFIDPSFVETLMLPESDIRAKPFVLRNPLSVNQSVMRTTMVPCLLDAVLRNLRNGWSSNLRLFEIGKVFLGDNYKDHYEPDVLAGAVVAINERNVFGPKVYEDFYTVKADIEALFKALSIKAEFLPHTEPFTHSRQTAGILVDNKKVGYIGRLKPLIQNRLEISYPVYLFEIDLNILLTFVPEEIRYKQPVVYPAVTRDISLLVDKEKTAYEVSKVLWEYVSDLVRDIIIFDVYEGPNIPQNKKSLAFRIVYQAYNRTLSYEEVDKEHFRLREVLKDHGFVVR